MCPGLLPTCLILLAPPAAAQQKEFAPKSVYVVATSPEAQRARGGIHHAKHGEAVTLYAVVSGSISKKPALLTTAPAPLLDGQVVKPGSHPDIRLRWYKVEPTGDSYNNTAGGFHWDPIEYQEHPLGPWGRKWRIPADAHPVGYPDTHDGLGTMGFKVAVKIGGKVFSSPGKESIFRGGKTPSWATSPSFSTRPTSGAAPGTPPRTTRPSA
jgi:hypothetical protein